MRWGVGLGGKRSRGQQTQPPYEDTRHPGDPRGPSGGHAVASYFSSAHERLFVSLPSPVRPYPPLPRRPGPPFSWVLHAYDTLSSPATPLHCAPQGSGRQDLLRYQPHSLMVSSSSSFTAGSHWLRCRDPSEQTAGDIGKCLLSQRKGCTRTGGRPRRVVPRPGRGAANIRDVKAKRSGPRTQYDMLRHNPISCDRVVFL